MKKRNSLVIFIAAWAEEESDGGKNIKTKKTFKSASEILIDFAEYTSIQVRFFNLSF